MSSVVLGVKADVQIVYLNVGVHLSEDRLPVAGVLRLTSAVINLRTTSTFSCDIAYPAALRLPWLAPGLEKTGSE